MAIKKLIKNKRFWLASLLVLITVGILYAFKPSFALADEAVQATLNYIIEPFLRLSGRLVIAMSEILVTIAGYTDFIHATAVEKGWVVMRDICNMFFVVILLVIAFATILKIESYQYKRLLGKLLLMAVLINFSKTICGLIIDAAQVVMSTFVDAFAGAAPGNFASAFGLSKLLAITRASGGLENMEVNSGEILIAYILAAVMSMIALIVIAVACLILLFRIVMLWILIVLSPLAYLAVTFPAGQKYSSQWWSKFANYVIVGPLLAFFLWLSLAVAGMHTSDRGMVEEFAREGAGVSLDKLTEKISHGDVGGTVEATGGVASGVMQTAITEAASSEHILGFMLASAMLIASMIMAQQIGVAGGSIAGSAVKNMPKWGAAGLKKTGSWFTRYPLRYGLAGGTGITGAAGGLVGGAVGLAGGIGGVKLSKSWRDNMKTVGSGIAKGASTGAKIVSAPTRAAGKVTRDKYKKTLESKEKKRQKRFEDFGMDSDSMEFLEKATGAIRGIPRMPGKFLRKQAAGWKSPGMRKAARAVADGLDEGLGMATMPLDVTHGAFKRGGEENRAARVLAEGAETDPDWWTVLKPTDAYPSGGLQKKTKKAYDLMGPQAVANLEASVHKIGPKELKALAKSFAAYKKDGGDIGKFGGAISKMKKRGGDYNPDNYEGRVNTGYMAGYDDEKFKNTMNLVNSTPEGQDYMGSNEFQQNPEQYYRRSEMEHLIEQAVAREKFNMDFADGEGYDNNSIQMMWHTNREGEVDEHARPVVMANLNNAERDDPDGIGAVADSLGIGANRAGAHLSGEEKEQMIAAVVNTLRKQFIAENQAAIDDPEQAADWLKHASSEQMGQNWEDMNRDDRAAALDLIAEQDANEVGEALRSQDHIRVINTGNEQMTPDYVEQHEEEHQIVREEVEAGTLDVDKRAAEIREEDPDFVASAEDRWGKDLDNEEIVTEHRTREKYKKHTANKGQADTDKAAKEAVEEVEKSVNQGIHISVEDIMEGLKESGIGAEIGKEISNAIGDLNIGDDVKDGLKEGLKGIVSTHEGSGVPGVQKVSFDPVAFAGFRRLFLGLGNSLKAMDQSPALQELAGKIGKVNKEMGKVSPAQIESAGSELEVRAVLEDKGVKPDKLMREVRGVVDDIKGNIEDQFDMAA